MGVAQTGFLSGAAKVAHILVYRWQRRCRLIFSGGGKEEAILLVGPTKRSRPLDACWPPRHFLQGDDMMQRLVLLFLLVLFQHSAFSAVYRCERDGGKITYQAEPCPDGSSVKGAIIRTSSPDSSGSVAMPNEKKQCANNEISLNFVDVPVTSMLQLVASISGYKLAADPSIKGRGTFRYRCIPWDELLKEIALRHDLIVKIENQTIVAHPR